jgi:uncharacterized membrane protein YgcG
VLVGALDDKAAARGVLLAARTTFPWRFERHGYDGVSHARLGLTDGREVGVRLCVELDARAANRLVWRGRGRGVGDHKVAHDLLVGRHDHVIGRPVDDVVVRLQVAEASLVHDALALVLLPSRDGADVRGSRRRGVRHRVAGSEWACRRGRWLWRVGRLRGRHRRERRRGRWRWRPLRCAGLAAAGVVDDVNAGVHCADAHLQADDLVAAQVKLGGGRDALRGRVAAHPLALRLVVDVRQVVLVPDKAEVPAGVLCGESRSALRCEQRHRGRTGSKQKQGNGFVHLRTGGRGGGGEGGGEGGGAGGGDGGGGLGGGG